MRKQPSTWSIVWTDNACWQITSIAAVVFAVALLIKLTGTLPGGRGKPDIPVDPEFASLILAYAVAGILFLSVIVALRVARIRSLFDRGLEIQATVRKVKRFRGGTTLKLELQHAGITYRVRTAFQRGSRTPGVSRAFAAWRRVLSDVAKERNSPHARAEREIPRHRTGHPASCTRRVAVRESAASARPDVPRWTKVETAAMESRLQRSAAALGRLVSHHAIHLGAFVVVLLVLFGWVSGEHLPLLLALIVAGRSALIGAEGMRKRWTEGDWRALHEHLVAELRALDPEDLASETADSELDPGTHPEALARTFVEERRRRHVEPRPGGELIAEWMGLLTFCLFLPIGFVLFTHDIVSSRRGYGFPEIGVTILCLAVYAWPHRWASVDGVGDRRSMWWVLPLVPALALVYTGVTIHHPYLDPRREDRGKLAAERVLALDSNVVAGAHADWVFAYAAELASHGEVEPAIALYRRGLHLAPRAGDARRQLAALERRLDPRAEVASESGDPRPRAHGLSADQFARLPLWDSRRSPHPVPSCRIDASLESVPRTTVVLVGLGSVPPGLIEAVGDVLHEELGLPVCRVEEPVPLPDADRVRGVVFGRQWNDAALVQHFRERSQPLPEAPLKYLLLTGADIYSEGSNFVFSSSRTFGVVLSYARYGDPGADWEAVRYRTAKQALGALIKSFDLPPASDPNCVTSYSNGVPQFDAKGNRPTAAAFLKFLERSRNKTPAGVPISQPAPVSARESLQKSPAHGRTEAGG